MKTVLNKLKKLRVLKDIWVCFFFVRIKITIADNVFFSDGWMKELVMFY